MWKKLLTWTGISSNKKKLLEPWDIVLRIVLNRSETDMQIIKKEFNTIYKKDLILFIEVRFWETFFLELIRVTNLFISVKTSIGEQHGTI